LELQAVLDRSATVFKRHAVIYLTLVISQPLSLLCKVSPLIDELSLYDVVNTPGVTADLSHISSIAVSCLEIPTATHDTEGVQKTTGYLPDNDGLKHALTGADLCIIPAGLPRRFPLSPTTTMGCFLREGYRQTWNDPRRPLQDQRWYRQGFD
jgi:hypothetical protein